LSVPVSIIIVTYKRPLILRRAIESILSQSHGDFELIISDDASHDETETVVQEYVRLDRRVRYRANQVNLGMPGNLNAALRECRNELVVNCHDSDLYHKDLIAKWVSLMEKYPSVGYATTNFHHLDENWMLPSDVDSAQPQLPEIMSGREFLRKMFFCWTNWAFGSWVWGTVMGRKSIYERMGYFDPEYGFVSDVDMWMRIALEYDVAILRGVHIFLAPRVFAPRLFDDSNLPKVVRRIFLRNRVRLARAGGTSLTRELAMHSIHTGMQVLIYTAGKWRRRILNMAGAGGGA